MDGAAEDFGEVEGVDVGEAGADEGNGGVVVCSEEGAAVGVGGGDIDWREGFVGFGVGYGWVERHGADWIDYLEEDRKATL